MLPLARACAVSLLKQHFIFISDFYVLRESLIVTAAPIVPVQPVSGTPVCLYVCPASILFYPHAASFLYHYVYRDLQSAYI